MSTDSKLKENIDDLMYLYKHTVSASARNDAITRMLALVESEKAKAVEEARKSERDRMITVVRYTVGAGKLHEALELRKKWDRIAESQLSTNNIQKGKK